MLFFFGKHHAQRGSDALCDFVLDLEDVLEFAVVAFGPHGMASAPFRKLGGDAKTVAGAAKAAIEHVGGAELLADLRGGKLLIAKRNHRRTRKELQLLNFSELRDYIFGHAVAKVFVVFISA